MAWVVIVLSAVFLFVNWTSGQMPGGNCLRPEGNRGFCRRLIECRPLLDLLLTKKPRPPEWATAYLKKSHCGFQGKHPIVCCPTMSKIKEFGKSVHEEDKVKQSLKIWCESSQPLDKVLGGTPALIHEFPWMALIRYKTKNGLEFRCGGSLVSDRYVLTAAHCVSDLKDIRPVSVRLGENDSEKGKDFDIQELIAHPRYQKPQLRNDIALIKLSSKVDFGESIRPVCLPLSSEYRETTSRDKKAVVAGWGITDSGTSTTLLQKVMLPLVSLEECSRIYDGKVPITDAQVCAGGELGKDSCAGDSGGPLHLVILDPPAPPRYFQYGIVSFGPRLCGTKGVPGVYTKVSSYIPWIIANLDSHKPLQLFHFN